MKRKNYKGKALPRKIKAHSTLSVSARIANAMEGRSKSERMNIAQMMVLPFILFYKIFIWFPNVPSRMLGAFRLVFFTAFLYYGGVYDTTEMMQGFFTGSWAFETFGAILDAVLTFGSYLQIPLSLLLILGLYNGMQVASGNSVTSNRAALYKVLAYRDSKMSNMTYDRQLKEMADTGFLGAGGLAGRQYRNASKTMDYLNSKLTNYSYEEGLNYIKSVFGAKK